MINILYPYVSGTLWVFHCLLPLPPENPGSCSDIPRTPLASGLTRSLPLSLLQHCFSTTQDTVILCTTPTSSSPTNTKMRRQLNTDILEEGDPGEMGAEGEDELTRKATLRHQSNQPEI